MSVIEIRDAVAADAESGWEVMRRSITELRLDDRRNDPKVLDAWLGNKQPRVFRAWLAEPDNSVLVAIVAGNVVGVSAMRNSGEITLNYVSPEARRFYLANGYVEAGPAEGRFGTQTGFPMSKALK